MGYKGFIERVDWLADEATSFIGNHGWLLYGISVAILFVGFTIAYTLYSGFSYVVIAVGLFASFVMGWILIPVYLLPIGILKILCYCLLNPKDAMSNAISILCGLLAAGLILFALYATFHGGH